MNNIKIGTKFKAALPDTKVFTGEVIDIQYILEIQSGEKKSKHSVISINEIDETIQFYE